MTVVYFVSVLTLPGSNLRPNLTCIHSAATRFSSPSGHDTYFQKDQSTPAHDLIERLLSSASLPPSQFHPRGALTHRDISNLVSHRLAESKRDNPSYNGLSFVQWIFLGNNSALLLDTADGDVEALNTILKEERFPDGWESAYVVSSFIALFECRPQLWKAVSQEVQGS